MKTLITTALAGLIAGHAVAARADIATCPVDHPSRAIAERYDARWQVALAGADSGALGALYDESAVLMPPTDETLVGRRPIAEYLAGGGAPGRASGYSVELVSCEVRGSALHVAAVWAEPNAGQAPWRSGNLLRVLEATGDGQWVATYEIWN